VDARWLSVFVITAIPFVVVIVSKSAARRGAKI
jgi:hypothetical protein